MVHNLWFHNLPTEGEQSYLPPRNVVLPPGNTAKYHAYTHIPSRGLITDCGKIVTNSWRMFVKDRLDSAWVVDREQRRPCNKCRRLDSLLWLTALVGFENKGKPYTK